MPPPGSLSGGAGAGAGGGASPGGVSFGFASPSASARALSSQQQAREWICLGCNRFYPPNVPFSMCPFCSQPGPQQSSAHMQRIMAQQKAMQQKAAAVARTARR